MAFTNPRGETRHTSAHKAKLWEPRNLDWTSLGNIISQFCCSLINCLHKFWFGENHLWQKFRIPIPGPFDLFLPHASLQKASSSSAWYPSANGHSRKHPASVPNDSFETTYINSKWEIPMYTHCNEKPNLQDKTTPTATDCKNKNHWTWMIKYLFFLYNNLVIYIFFRWLWGSLAPPMAPSALDAPCPGPGKQLTNCNKEY